MNTRLYSSSETLRISANLDRIEFNLGHPVPMNLVDMDMLAKKSLSQREIDTIVVNIKRVEFAREKNPVYDFIEQVFSVVFFVMIVIEIVKSVCCG